MRPQALDIGTLAESLNNIWLRTTLKSDEPLELGGIQFVDESGRILAFNPVDKVSTGSITINHAWKSLADMWIARTGLDYTSWKNQQYRGVLPVLLPNEVDVRFQEPTPQENDAQHIANLFLVLGRVPAVYSQHYSFLRNATALEYPRLEWYAFEGDTASSVLSGFYVDNRGKRTGAAFTATITTTVAQDFPTMLAIPVDAVGALIYLTENVRVEISDADTRITDLQTNKANHPVLNSGEIIPLAGIF